jgi:Protein of unknown function (DUF4058)
VQGFLAYLLERGDLASVDRSKFKSLLNECCEEGRYVDDIDYREYPDPPLSRDDAQWADSLLREHGRR